MKQILIYIIIFFFPQFIWAQNYSGSVNDCNKDMSNIQKEIKDLDEEYKAIKEDLKAGYFCSECKRSKTEIERYTKESFEKHLGEVKGEAVPATQEQFDKAHANYVSRRNSLLSKLAAQDKRCKDEYKRAVDEENRRKKEAWENEQQKRAENQRKYEEQRRAAQAAAEKERQEAQERMKALQEAQRQQTIENNQRLAADIQRNTEDSRRFATEFANNSAKKIQSIDLPTNKIEFSNSDNRDKTDKLMNNYKLENIKENLNNVDDDFTPEDILRPKDDYIVPIIKDIASDYIGRQEVIGNIMNGYQAIQSFYDVVKDYRQGEITSNTTDVIFSYSSSNSYIQQIQKAASKYALDIHKNSFNVLEKAFNQFNSDDNDDDYQSSNNYNADRYINNERPSTYGNYIKKGAVVVAGAAVATVASPWIAIGAVAWYGFTH